MILEREKQILESVPDIFDYKTLLYIGAHPNRIQIVLQFVEARYEIDVVEIWPVNVAGLKNMNMFKNVIEGDVRNIDSLVGSLYDVVMWWHGPEHIPDYDLDNVLIRLLRLTNEVCVLASPYGLFPQQDHITEANPYEKHFRAYYPIDFEERGWEVKVWGESDVPGGNLIAWKRE